MSIPKVGDEQQKTNPGAAATTAIAF